MSAPDQTIFRVACRHKPYSQLGNAALRDKRLSLEARGALAMILSYPSNFSFNSKWLQKECDIGRDRARAIISDLTTYGYCQRTTIRKKDGTIKAYEYVFTDEPQHLVDPQPENPGPGPGPGNPGPGSTGAGKTTPYKRNNTSLREEKEKEVASATQDSISDFESEGKSSDWIMIKLDVDRAEWAAWGAWMISRSMTKDLKAANASGRMWVPHRKPTPNSPYPKVAKPAAQPEVAA